MSQNHSSPKLATYWSLFVFLLALILLVGGTSLHWVNLWGAGRSSPARLNVARLAEQTAVFATYGGSASCRECHEEEFAAWTGSHHGQAERAPSTAMDEAAFVPSRAFKHESQQTSVRNNGGRYEVIATGLHGTNEVFPVQRVLGLRGLGYRSSCNFVSNWPTMRLLA